MDTFRPQINRFNTAIPIYVQIAETLLNRIESGELVPGDRLPPERELSEMLSVNRMTVRRALNMLAGQGLLIRRRGDGTYVAGPKIELNAGRLFPFTKGMQRKGYMPGARVITFEKKMAGTSVASFLSLPVSAPVYYVHRLRLINQEPVMLEEFTIPTQRFQDFENFDLTSRSLFEILETEYQVTVSQARQSLEPVLATEYEAQLLEIEKGAPLMLERRVSLDQDGYPIEYSKELYRGDRFRFVTEIASLDL
ncbi:MAG: GntR family transcriptional regulator [Anaerolineales bacterium]|nr:GntR family transcriptional regulator [Anaerolineales bacterium]